MSSTNTRASTGIRVVRALTLTNPWAHAIAHHGKTVENRTWYGPRHIDELHIHAGKGWDPDAAPLFTRLGITPPGRDTIATSAIVAVARLDGICSTTLNLPDHICGCGPWAAAGQHHWRLVDVRPLHEPVRCSGRLGLWEPSPELLDAVHAQLPGNAPAATR